MVSYFLSDIHLKSSSKSLDDNSSRLLLFFFQEVWSQTPGDVYLLGDIFDIWVSDHSVFSKKYKFVIDELVKVKSQGYRVVYFEGNHDLHLKRFWQDQLGFEVCFDVKYFEIDGLMVRLEHGDLINQQDHEYLKLRKFLRSPQMLFWGHWLPGIFWNWIGEMWSRKSRRNSFAYLVQKKADVVKMIRAHAQQAVQEKYFDVVITGHMHVVDDFEFTFQGKKVRSINLGTWLDGPKVLKLIDREFSWFESPKIPAHH